MDSLRVDNFVKLIWGQQPLSNFYCTRRFMLYQLLIQTPQDNTETTQ